MPINWDSFQKALSPIKDYNDLIQRFEESFSYPFVCTCFNLTMPQLVNYTRQCLGGDPKGRYVKYAAFLEKVFSTLDQAGVQDTLDLVSRLDSPEKLEGFVDQAGIRAEDIAEALKFLVYWLIPGKKYLSSLVREDPEAAEAIRVLREKGVRTNLDILQEGITAEGRKALAEYSGLSESMIWELVCRADFSRMPWASKATISNIMGAGYGSLEELRSADPQKLFEDFFRYGQLIGKNLKLGNEIENSYRIAQIVPALVQS